MAETLTEAIERLKAQFAEEMRGHDVDHAHEIIDAWLDDLHARPVPDRRRNCSKCQNQVPIAYIVSTWERPARMYCLHCWVTEMTTDEFILHFIDVEYDAVHRLERAEPLPDLPPEVWEAAADIPDPDEPKED